MFRHHRRHWPAVIAILAFFTAGASAQLSKQIPSDAVLVIKVSNLQSTNTKLANTAKQWGIDQILPQFADPLGYVEEQIPLANQDEKAATDSTKDKKDATANADKSKPAAEADQSQHKIKGLDRKGDLAIVMLKPKDADPESWNKYGLILVPVSDYAAFVKNFENPKTEGAITTVTMPGGGSDDGYIAHWGNYAAISPVKETVSAPPTSPLAMQGLSAEEFDKKDIVVYANFTTIRELALPQLQKNRAMIIDQITQGIQQQRRSMARNNTRRSGASTRPSNTDNAAQKVDYGPVLKSAVTRGLDVAEAFLKDTDAATYGIDFSGNGIKTTTLFQFNPNTYPAQLTAKWTNTTESMLTGLPSAKYLFFMGFKAHPEIAAQSLSDLLGNVPADLAKTGDTGQQVVSMIDTAKSMMRAQTGGVSGWIAPSPNGNLSSLFQLLQVINGDSAKIRAGQKEMLKYQSAFMKITQGPGMETESTYTPDAKTVDGVSFDKIQNKFTITGNSPQERQVKQLLRTMYGPNGMEGYAAAVDPNHYLTVFSPDDALISKALQSIKTNSNPMGDLAGVKTVSAALPPNRFLEMYFPVDNLVATGVAYAKQFGMPINLPLPPNLPPVGLTASTEANCVRVDSYIPNQLVNSMIAAGMQMFMAIQGGGAPGGPGGL